MAKLAKLSFADRVSARFDFREFVEEFVAGTDGTKYAQHSYKLLHPVLAGQVD